MDPEIQNKLDEHTQKLDAIYSSVEKTRKYFLWTMIISIVVFVLPLIGIVFLLPTVIGGLTGGLLEIGL